MHWLVFILAQAHYSEQNSLSLLWVQVYPYKGCKIPFLSYSQKNKNKKKSQAHQVIAENNKQLCYCDGTLKKNQ